MAIGGKIKAIMILLGILGIGFAIPVGRIAERLDNYDNPSIDVKRSVRGLVVISAMLITFLFTGIITIVLASQSDAFRSTFKWIFGLVVAILGIAIVTLSAIIQQKESDIAQDENKALIGIGSAVAVIGIGSAVFLKN